MRRLVSPPRLLEDAGFFQPDGEVKEEEEEETEEGLGEEIPESLIGEMAVEAMVAFETILFVLIGNS